MMVPDINKLQWMTAVIADQRVTVMRVVGVRNEHRKGGEHG